MNKKIWIYTGVLATLVIAAYFFVFNEKSTTLSGKEDDFTIENTDEIEKIYLAGRGENEEILLEKKDGYWLVNDSFKARHDAIKTLLETMNQIRVNYPVPKTKHNSIVREMSSQATKVEIYDGSNSLIKSYYVGKPTEDYKGTYMLMKGAGKPYVVHIPGFDGYVSSRYFLDIKDWRSRKVFSYQPQEIQSIRVAYPKGEKEGFLIERIEDTIEVRTLHDRDISADSIHPKKVLYYMSFYKKVFAEGFENEYFKKDSILSSTPNAVITVKTRSGEVNEVPLYRMPVTQRTKKQIDERGRKMTYDPDRYFALINHGKDFVIVQDFVFQDLLLEYESFLRNSGKEERAFRRKKG